MVALKNGTVLFVAAFVVLAGGSSPIGQTSVVKPTQAQTTKRCSPVTPMNSQEAVAMEQNAGRDGCWVRGPKGELLFVSDKPPSANFPALLKPSAPRPQPTCTDVTRISRDVSGTWLVNLKCTDGCGHIAPATPEPSNIQTVTLETNGPNAYHLIFGSFPNADGCSRPINVTNSSKGAVSALYEGTDKRNDQGCYQSRSVAVDVAGAGLGVGLRVHDQPSNTTYAGWACRTSAQPGFWLAPVGSLPGTWKLSSEQPCFAGGAC
jgi:hypothetical protein